MTIAGVSFSAAVASAAIWVGLLGFRGQFWRSDQYLEEAVPEREVWPSVCAVVPARNEASLLPVTLRSLLQQDYPGSFTIILIDDQSTDGTAEIAQQVAQELQKSHQLQILNAEPLPAGWSGKLWAIEQGIRKAERLTPAPDYFLLTDADIAHDPVNLRRLVAKAEQDQLDLTSLMVLLRCESFWEKLLIPAFVFFFQKLYPFRLANDPNSSVAAAAGGCILIRQLALARIGGMQVIRQALIDDCALAKAVKSTSASRRIWLGLTHSTCSVRPYPSLSSIWQMVARTAFTQLGYSPFQLVGTIMGMTLVYLVPPLAVLLGGLSGNWATAIVGLITWAMMTIAYWPTIRLYRCSPWFAGCLPIIALLYTLMTWDSAFRHWQGQGGSWKGRVYAKG